MFQLLVVTVITVFLLSEFRSRTALGEAWSLMRGVQLFHAAWACAAFISVGVVASLAWAVPVLRWSWWSAIGGSGTPTGANGLAFIEVALPVVLVALIPLLAHREELVFRAGSEHQGSWRRFRRCVWFGLVHAVMGVPFAGCLGLAAAGGVFTAAYRRGYARTSQSLHARLPREQRTGMLVSLRAASADHVEGDPLAAMSDETVAAVFDDLIEGEIAPRARDAAVADATRVHALYNWSVCALVLTALALSA